MATITVRGETMFYAVNRPPGARGSLVFIHGAGADNSLWAHQMDGLPAGFAGYAVDLPGHGQSGGQPINDVGEYAQAVAEFIRSIDAPRPVYLVGQSMGGAISLTVALETSGVIDGLVLIGAGAKMRVAPALLEALSQGRSDPAFVRLSFSPHADPGLIEGYMASQADVPVNTFYQDFLACSVFDVSQRIGEINLPTLIVVGLDDKMTPVKLSHFMHESIKDSQLVTIENAGHMTMLEQPEKLNRVISAFVEG